MHKKRKLTKRQQEIFIDGVRNGVALSVNAIVKQTKLLFPDKTKTEVEKKNE